jgi:hypothetical protein
MRIVAINRRGHWLEEYSLSMSGSHKNRELVSSTESGMDLDS